MADTRRSIEVLLGALGGIGCAIVLLCGVGGVLLWKLNERLFDDVRRELVWTTACEGEDLTVEYVSRRNNLAGVTTNRHLEATFRGEQLALDGEEAPDLYTWNRTARRERGEGPDAVHFFVGPLSREDAGRFERCVEADVAGLLAALEASDFPPPQSAPWMGRRRVYWSGAPSDLVPVFVADGRTLRLERSGSLTLVQPLGGGTMESVVGAVRADPSGPRLECCERVLEASELPRFVDSEGRSLPERLGGVEASPPTF